MPIEKLPGSGETSRRPEQKNEALAHEWTALTELWLRTRPSIASDQTARIDKLFEERQYAHNKFKSGAEEWSKLNAAELAVGSMLAAPQLRSEFASLLRIAAARRHPDHEYFRGRFELLETALAQDAAQAEKEERIGEMRETYLALLYTLQSAFVQGRNERDLRIRAARRLFATGAAIIFLASAITIAAYYFSRWWYGIEEREIGQLFVIGENLIPVLTLVASLGVVGAFFSRVLMFRPDSVGIDFDTFMRDFHLAPILLRLMFGGIAATLFYFLLSSGLVDGAIFPDLSPSSEPPPGDDTTENWKTTLGKLIVWAFLAGFSERMIPNLLASTEARAQSAAAPSASASGGPAEGKT